MSPSQDGKVGSYLSVFLFSAAAVLVELSQGTVNFTSFTSFVCWLIMTGSGYWAVMATSGGMEGWWLECYLASKN